MVLTYAFTHGLSKQHKKNLDFHHRGTLNCRDCSMVSLVNLAKKRPTKTLPFYYTKKCVIENLENFKKNNNNNTLTQISSPSGEQLKCIYHIIHFYFLFPWFLHTE